MSVESPAWVADLVAEREIKAALGRYRRGLDRLDEDSADRSPAVIIRYSPRFPARETALVT